MDREDALTSITMLLAGATSVGAFLPKLTEFDNDSLSMRDYESLRLGEMFVVGITMACGVLGAIARKSVMPFVAASMFSFLVLAIWEYKAGGYELQ